AVSTATLVRADQQQPPVVIELFTSQGCNSCPPADDLLAELAKREGIIALGFHVDYWDYIGWRDPFSSPMATVRQRDYAAGLALPFIYTPQMVLNGRYQVVGSKRLKVEHLIEMARLHQPLISLEARIDHDLLTVDLPNIRPDVYELVWAEFDQMHHTDVKRGENRGRTLQDANVVRNFEVIGQWDGKAQRFTRKLTKPKDMAALLVQIRNAGPMIAAGLIHP
ncbi:MAG: DUF1223 domain-containing protein, partial [Pseudomonadota bacterium]